MNRPAEDNPDLDEPFGMQGVLSYVRPLLAILCGACAIGCFAMAVRSSEIHDAIERHSNSSTLVVHSLYGRFQVDVGAALDSTRSSVDYFPFSGRLRRPDTWQQSPLKRIGLEWGDDVAQFANGDTLAVWRFRAKWRTLGLLYSIPPILGILTRLRRRREREQEALAGGDLS